MSELKERALRILVVDDEAPARRRLRDLIEEDGCASTIAESSDGVAAIEALRVERWDLVFLDVQMPECSGIDVVDRIGPAHMPLTIFVTAYDQHAIRAFESEALDYLLKPFSDERFERALARSKIRLVEQQSAALSQTMLQLTSWRADGPNYMDRLAVKADGVTRFVPVGDIEWIESAGMYVTVHFAGHEILHRASMKDMAERLDPRRFIRIHRSAIVNIDRVTQLEPMSHGEFEVVLRSGARARVSRSYRAQFEARLGQSL